MKEYLDGYDVDINFSKIKELESLKFKVTLRIETPSTWREREFYQLWSNAINNYEIKASKKGSLLNNNEV